MSIIALLCAVYLQISLFAKEVANDTKSTPAPYWKSKSVYKDIVEKRALEVSAKVDKAAAEKGRSRESLQIVAVGHVSAPLSFSWKKVQEFERLPKVSSHFNKAQYDSAKKQLYLHISALGYNAHMNLQMAFEEKPLWKEIRWECLSGAFRGMKGTIRLEDYKRRKTEMSLVSNHETEKLPLPPVLKAFVLETVGQRVAGLMREYIENEYKKDQKQ